MGKLTYFPRFIERREGQVELPMTPKDSREILKPRFSEEHQRYSKDGPPKDE